MKEVLLSSALIMAIVEALKAAGLPKAYVKVAVAVVTVLLYSVATVAEMWPETAGVVEMLLQVALVILGAMGFYDAGMKPLKRWVAGE